MVFIHMFINKHMLFFLPQMTSEELLLSYLALFDTDALPELVWVDSCDAETMEYCKYRLKDTITYYEMVNLLKLIFKE